jgi:hypothetical protein
VVEIDLLLNLPTDDATLPLVRNLCSRCLGELGVHPRCIADVEVSLAAACTRVIERAADDDKYDVHVVIGERACEVSVVDGGQGYDFVNRLQFLDEPSPG